MKTRFLITIFIFISFLLPLFSQKDNDISLGVYLTYDFKEYDTSKINLGNDLGIFCNLFFKERFTFSSALSYGYKNYDISVTPVINGAPVSTQKSFKEESISFDADIRYNVEIDFFDYYFVKNSSNSLGNIFVGLGLKTKLPQRIRGLAGTEINPFSSEKEWNPFVINQKDLTINFGLKLNGGVEFTFLENYLISFEIGDIFFLKDDFKDLRDTRRKERIDGNNQNENYRYFKIGVGYIL